VWLVLLGALVGRVSCSCFFLYVCLCMSVCVFSVSSGLRLLPCIAFCRGFVGFVLSGWACPFWCLCCPACRPSLYVTIYLQRETEEKARQPETKLSANAQTRHIARLRDAKRSRTRNPKPTHGARDRPKQSQLRARKCVKCVQYVYRDKRSPQDHHSVVVHVRFKQQKEMVGYEGIVRLRSMAMIRRL
jgi:hypothetical protein